MQIVYVLGLHGSSAGGRIRYSEGGGHSVALPVQPNEQLKVSRYHIVLTQLLPWAGVHCRVPNGPPKGQIIYLDSALHAAVQQ